MGRDKGLLPLAGRPLIEHVLAAVEELGDEIVITTNNPDQYAYLGIRLAGDESPGAGALFGLRTALLAAREETVLLVACDMPFLNRAFLAHMLRQASGADLVVPRWEDRYQTLHAVYDRRVCLHAVSTALANGERRMISFYPHIRVQALPEATVARYDPEGRTFFNVNTPEDLDAAEVMLDATRPR